MSARTLARPFAVVAVVALLLGAAGCSSSSHAHHDPVSDFDTVFTVTSSDPAGVICCPGETVVLSLELFNLGPYHDHYETISGRTHRFEVVDHHGHVVWDSWYHESPFASERVYDLAAGDSIEFLSTWRVVDDDGFDLAPGTYTIYASYSGVLTHFGFLDDPPPVVVDVIFVVSS